MLQKKKSCTKLSCEIDMIWYSFSVNGPHLWLDVLLLISAVNIVGLMRLDKDVNEVNVE